MSRLRVVAALLLRAAAGSSSSSSSSSAPPPPPPSVASPVGAPRAPPLAGFGNEIVFQNTGDAQLGAALAAAGSALQRFPGGTPADYFDLRAGWLLSPTGPGCGGCDALPRRAAPPAALAGYLGATRQRAVLVVNQLTAGLDDALAGLRAEAAAGVRVEMLEMGNEMFDATRADVLAAYPQPADYARKMANWSDALAAAFPAARIAWVGLANDWDARTRAWNAEVFPLAPASVSAATVHLYPGLPPLNLTDASQYPALLAGLFPLLGQYRDYTDASIPARLRIWVTEWGTWSTSPAARNTWLQALWHVALSAQLPTALPRLDVLLPYCAVCGDPQMPSFTTDEFGPIVPPNVTMAPGAWRRTASGHGYALLLAPLYGAVALQGLSFLPNAVLDPATPGSVALVGLRTLDAAGHASAVVLVNLGAAAAALDLSPSLSGAPAACASTWAPANATDAARAGIRVEELAHQEAAVGADGALALPPYAIAVVSAGACGA